MILIDRFEEYIKKSGYVVSRTSYPQIRECIKEDSDETVVIQLIDMTAPPVSASAAPEALIDNRVFREQTKNTVETCGGENVSVLTLFFGSDSMRILEAAGDDPMCWFIDPDRHTLIIEESRVKDFHGLRASIVNFLVNTNGQDADQEKSVPGGPAPVTVALVAINVTVFLVSAFVMPECLEYGMMDYDRVSEGQIYRLFTAMFLHGGVDHIVSNMISLYFMGALVERTAGSLKFSVLYMMSGVAGNIASYYFEMLSGCRYTSVGASGAIYGIMGAVIILALKKRSGLNATKRRLFIAVAYCIYSSFAMPGIDYAAHIGGLICGLTMGTVATRFT